MIKFCHISPTLGIPLFAHLNGAHLILAHLIEENREYREFYDNLEDGKYRILDNSAFEMFKTNRPMYDSSKLIEMGKRCRANSIVMSDYPREDWQKTVNKATETIDDITRAGFDPFFCPQSRLGDISGFMKGVDWALDNPKIKLIGISILACPIALGIDEKMDVDKRNDSYKMQRFLSRWKIFTLLEQQGALDKKAHKRFHCLGMTDGPNEIKLLQNYHDNIFSWDSSAAVWNGVNGRTFDQSPTGLAQGKFEKEVDFSFKDFHPTSYYKVKDNIYMMEAQVKGNNKDV